MKDKLENFIEQNRSSFDDKEPGEKIWKGIEQSLPASKGKNWWNAVVIWRAAAVFFMVTTIYLFIPRMAAHTERNDQALKEFSDVEQFYFQQIADKEELIGQFQDADGLNGFTHDFHQLEAMYLVLKEEMKVRPSKKVKDALILNLLVRIDLLNQQLHKLEQEGEQEESGEVDEDKSST